MSLLGTYHLQPHSPGQKSAWLLLNAVFLVFLNLAVVFAVGLLSQDYRPRNQFLAVVFAEGVGVSMVWLAALFAWRQQYQAEAPASSHGRHYLFAVVELPLAILALRAFVAWTEPMLAHTHNPLLTNTFLGPLLIQGLVLAPAAFLAAGIIALLRGVRIWEFVVLPLFRALAAPRHP